MANTPDKSELSDDERAELRAMIAAGRDLSPEMDESLVDSYAERRAAEQQAKAKVQGNAVVPQQQSGGTMAGTNPAVAIAGMVMVAAIFVTIMVVSGGAYWWMIFPLIGICGGWWGNHDRRRLDERRAQRYQMRADYYRTRMGYPPEQDARRLPESTEATTRDSGPLPPPTSAPTQAPPPARSIPPASAPPSRPSTSASGEQPPTNPAG
jgi:Spy/CpxP family protein refolding chaperone